MKYLKLLLLSILQFISVFAFLYFYNEWISIKGAKLPISLSFYYYIMIVFPITIIAWNIIFVNTKNTKTKYSLFCVPLLVILLYWINSIGTYPYRVSFTILISVVTLLIGNIFINRRILKNK
jgi:hypothetical protein